MRDEGISAISQTQHRRNANTWLAVTSSYALMLLIWINIFSFIFLSFSTPDWRIQSTLYYSLNHAYIVPCLRSQNSRVCTAGTVMHWCRICYMYGHLYMHSKCMYRYIVTWIHFCGSLYICVIYFIVTYIYIRNKDLLFKSLVGLPILHEYSSFFSSY